MPYRRLPNTDTARLKSLNSAFTKGKDLPPFKLAFSPSSFRKMQSSIPQFEMAISNWGIEDCIFLNELGLKASLKGGRSFPFVKAEFRDFKRAVSVLGNRL